MGKFSECLSGVDFRAIVRPIIAISITWASLYIAIRLVLKDDVELQIAMQIFDRMMILSGTIAGFYFGERAAKKK